MPRLNQHGRKRDGMGVRVLFFKAKRSTVDLPSSSFDLSFSVPHLGPSSTTSQAEMLGIKFQAIEVVVLEVVLLGGFAFQDLVKKENQRMKRWQDERETRTLLVMGMLDSPHNDSS
jgi:hypothetical protein